MGGLRDPYLVAQITYDGMYHINEEDILQVWNIIYLDPPSQTYPYVFPYVSPYAFPLSCKALIKALCHNMLHIDTYTQACRDNNIYHWKISFLNLVWHAPGLSWMDLICLKKDLHKLINLKKLEIQNCCKLRKFLKEFGEKGVFHLLKILSLAALSWLEELPIINEGAMYALAIFTIMLCETLEILPKRYLNIRSLKKLRVWGCSMVLENLEKVERTNKIV